MIKGFFRDFVFSLGTSSIGLTSFFWLCDGLEGYFWYFVGFGVLYTVPFFFLKRSYWLSGLFHRCRA